MYEMEEGGMKDGSSTGSSSETEVVTNSIDAGLKGLHDDKGGPETKVEEMVLHTRP